MHGSVWARFAFARRYSRNSYWSLFLVVLRCFTSHGLLPVLLQGDRNFFLTGFPIRTSPDQRLLGTSPKRIAAKSRPSSPSSSQGIHRTPLVSIRKLANHFALSFCPAKWNQYFHLLVFLLPSPDPKRPSLV